MRTFWTTLRLFMPALAVSGLLLWTGAAGAAEYYLAPGGNDAAPGSMDAPFATLQKAVSVAAAGDTVWIRGGTYQITTPATSGAGVNFTKSGTSDSSRIKYWAYPGEHPLFDFSKMTVSTTGYTHGFVIAASYLHFKGLKICCVPMNTSSNNGVAVTSGGYDIFEQLDMHHNNGNGIFIGSKTAGGHLVLNCDAHDNYDPNSSQGMGQNADGFGVHYQTTGATTIVRGCRAWWNSDDGYDLINQEVPVTVESSWSFDNGYANYGDVNPSDGNGNGFKMGSSKTGVRHLVQNNVAWKNKASGFYANHSSGGNSWYNNTSFMNGTQYNMLASPPDMPDMTITLSGAMAHIMRNNIGYPNKNSNMTGVDSMFNSWDLMLTPASSDFASVSDPSVSMTGMAIEGTGAMGPRKADGSLPDVDFLKLVAASRMIDKGTDVGLPFVGAAPDLGAYEYGAAATGAGGAVSPGTGGTTGGAGSAGTATGGKMMTGGMPGAGGAGMTTGSGGRTSGSGGAGGRGATASGGTGIIATGGASPATGSGGVAVTGSGGISGGTGGASGAGGAGTPPAGTTSAGGCSCDAGGGQTSATLTLAAAVLGVLVARRRRRA